MYDIKAMREKFICKKLQQWNHKPYDLRQCDWGMSNGMTSFWFETFLSKKQIIWEYDFLSVLDPGLKEQQNTMA